MNVYDEIAANDRKTVIILCAFPIALFITVFLILLLFAKTNILPVLISYTQRTDILNDALQLTLKIFPWMFLAAFLWIAFSYYRGGAMILEMTHASQITFDENRELYRLVENTAIMIGLPTPKIYLIDDDSMNAFAVGRNPKTASIALTNGIVKTLDNAELQAVIAHELAHINNHDTRLMLITIAGIGCFIFFGEVLCRSVLHGGRHSRSRKSGKGTLIILAIGIACLIFGYLVAPILRFALSRRREYQADSTAVKTIRDPEALVRALSKIAEESESRVKGPDFNSSSLAGNKEDFFSSPLISNMCIVSSAKIGFFSKLYSTHPPINDRIAALRKLMVSGKAQI
jgi:heat shock protein HtpX